MEHFGKYSNVGKDFSISIDTQADPALFLDNLNERHIDFLIEANQEDFKIELPERLTKFDFLIEASQEDFKIELPERLTKFDFLIEASQEDFKIGLRERLTKIEAFVLDNVSDVNLFIHETPQRYSIILDNIPDANLFIYETPQRYSISIENALVLHAYSCLSGVNTRVAKYMGFEADVVLESLSGIWSALKSISIDSFSTMNSHLHETAISYITKSQQNNTLLSSKATFVMGTFRILGDMDNNYLLDFDDFEFDNLDYVIT